MVDIEYNTIVHRAEMEGYHFYFTTVHTILVCSIPGGATPEPTPENLINYISYLSLVEEISSH